MPNCHNVYICVSVKSMLPEEERAIIFSGCVLKWISFGGFLNYLYILLHDSAGEHKTEEPLEGAIGLENKICCVQEYKSNQQFKCIHCWYEGGSREALAFKKKHVEHIRRGPTEPKERHL